MPEFVHSFTNGRMNKDLDERLIPNGEYRDALNLDLANSEGANVGTLQNVKGNREQRGCEGCSENWSADYIDALQDPVVIGSIRHDETERIYWFIAAPAKTGSFPYGVSAIAEYDQTTDLVKPVLVDTAGILKFSQDYLITGINILDKFLFWTDDQTEPKKINIEKFKTGSVDFTTHTKIPKWLPDTNVYQAALTGQPDFVEADVTTIKLSPLTAPTINASVSEYGDNIPGTGLTPVTTTFNHEGLENFTFIPNPTTAPNTFISYPTYGEYLENRESGAYMNSSFNNPTNNPNYDATYGWTGEVTFQVNTPSPAWEPGRLIIMTGEFDNIFGENTKYSIQMSIVSMSGLSITGRIQAISSNIGKTISGDGTSTPIVWECLLQEKDALFEYNFPRFAYRWKYIDNEYSVYSPFSEVAFKGGEFEYLAADGYNLGMVNNIRKLFIEDLTWGSEEVSELDILYKEARSTAIYVVDTLKKQDYASLPVSFEIKNELIGAVVEANQILRPWDNVPRKAKSQEIIGNRIVYANYLQNYSTSGVINLSTNQVSTDVDLSLSLFSETHPGNATNPDPNPYTRLPRPSLKSIRTYQIGVVYKDAYGRETPVFTSQDASLKVEIDKSVSISKLQVTPNNIPPAWATNYKFFVKETANEYYNLALDKFYPAEDGNVWLSFPSSERNKIDEETYLILKKQHDNNVPVETLNRYKILSIQPEAPLFVSQFDEFVASADVTTTNEVEPGRITLNFTGPSNDNNPAFFGGFNGGNKIKISIGGNDSEFYNVVDVSNSGTNGVEYTVQLTQPLGAEVAAVGIGTNIVIKIYTEERKDLPEFDGRFFAKINRDFAFDTNIIASFKALAPRYAIKDEIDFLATVCWSGAAINPHGYGYYYADNSWNGGGNCNEGSDPGYWSLTGWEGPDWGPYGINMNYEKTWYGGYAPPTRGRTTFGFIYAGLKKYENVDFMSGGTFGYNEVRTPSGLISAGAKIRFKAKNGTLSDVYQILETTSRLTFRGERGQDFFGGCYDEPSRDNGKLGILVELDKPITEEWMPDWGDWGKLGAVLPSIQVVENVSTDGNKLLTSSNPAIFETEPKESVDLDLYYEASDALPISQYNNANQILSWFNCYSYGTGVESNRVRDDYNAVYIDKGPKVSTVLDEPYAEERRGSGFIFSQIYNSTSGINRLNQFIQAEPITKDLNPIHGTIQKLHARDTDLITLCEDKCFRVLANKDALYNADGNVNLTGNNAVLGQAVPYAGEFGISKNPESFAAYGFRVYFSDKNRGAVIRLSRDGITEISSKGMSDFFENNLRVSNNIIGSYDSEKGLYNITLDNLSQEWQNTLSEDKDYQLNPDCNIDANLKCLYTTISFKEEVDGWTSRKSFIQESGVSLNNRYYTFKNGLIWEHGLNVLANNFYGVQYDSSFNVIINEMPQSVKGFSTLNYTGTQSRLLEYLSGSRWYSIAEVNASPEISADIINPLTYNQVQQKQPGWYVNYVKTDLEGGEIKEFQKKEGKKFNYIKALEIFNDCEIIGDGIGPPVIVECPPQEYILTITIDEDCSGSGGVTPDTLFTGWYHWSYKGSLDGNIVNETTAQDAKCVIDDFYTLPSGVSVTYSAINIANEDFMYVFADGINPGTQMYNRNTLQPLTESGTYLYIKSPAGAIPNNSSVDPNNPTPVPATYSIVIWGNDGIIDSVTQYNTLAACEQDCLPDTPIYFYWFRDWDDSLELGGLNWSGFTDLGQARYFIEQNFINYPNAGPLGNINAENRYNIADGINVGTKIWNLNASVLNPCVHIEGDALYLWIGSSTVDPNLALDPNDSTPIPNEYKFIKLVDGKISEIVQYNSVTPTP